MFAALQWEYVVGLVLAVLVVVYLVLVLIFPERF